MHWLSQTRTTCNGRYNAFSAPVPPTPRDWHGGPFPTHGELAQGLSLTMRPTRTASPLCFFLTAVTRNLAIARFLCENSGPFWGMFSKIRLDIHPHLDCSFLRNFPAFSRNISVNHASLPWKPTFECKKETKCFHFLFNALYKREFVTKDIPC